jgi:hypothetical protein
MERVKGKWMSANVEMDEGKWNSAFGIYNLRLASYGSLLALSWKLACNGRYSEFTKVVGFYWKLSLLLLKASMHGKIQGAWNNNYVGSLGFCCKLYCKHYFIYIRQ